MLRRALHVKSVIQSELSVTVSKIEIVERWSQIEIYYWRKNQPVMFDKCIVIFKQKLYFFLRHVYGFFDFFIYAIMIGNIFYHQEKPIEIFVI